MVRHVQRGEAGIDCGFERTSGPLRFQRVAAPLLVRDLPQPGQDPGRLQSGGQPGPFYRAHSGGNARNKRSVSTPRRRSRDISRR